MKYLYPILVILGILMLGQIITSVEDWADPGRQANYEACLKAGFGIFECQ